jgi:hypothetical protein
MATHMDRIDLLELEMRFRRWLWHERLLESLSIEQLEEYAILGRLPEPLPKCLPMGKSALDGVDRKRLRQLWEENTRRFVGRRRDELIFFCFHGHWPEQACSEQPCSKAWSEESVSQYETRKASKNE